MLKPKENKAVSICPGPNLAYFSGKYSLKEMVQHIYGYKSVLNNVMRPNMFVKELSLYLIILKMKYVNRLKKKMRRNKKN